MKSGTRAMLLAGACLACGLLIGFLCGRRPCHTETLAPPNGPAEVPIKPHPHIIQKTKQSDLGGGIAYYEVRGVSADGETWLRNTVIYRDGKPVFMKEWDKCFGHNKSGRHLEQLYYENGKLLLIERDEDGDGLFDQLILFDDKELPTQAFEEKPDGEIVPLSNDRVRKMRADWEESVGIMKPMIEGVKKAKTLQERKDLIDDAIRKTTNGK